MTSMSKKGGQSTTAQYNILNNPYFTTDTPASSTRGHHHQPQYMNGKDDSPFIHASRKSSKAKTELNYSRSGNSNSNSNYNYTASIKQRIQKACSTLSTADLQRENAILVREVQKLEKQLLRRDQQIIDMRTQVMPSKQVKAQIIQLYRALNYFEGKTKQMENSMSKFRDMILKASNEGVTVDNLNVLFEQLRRDNEQLSAQLQQTEYMRSNAQQNLNRLRTKYYQSQRELSQFKRRQTSPLQQYYMSTGFPVKSVSNPKINMLFNKMMAKNAPTQMELKEKEVLLKQTQGQLEDAEKKVIQMYQIMEKLNKENQTIKYQNKELKGDLDEKDKQITDLFKQCMSLKKNLKRHESQFQSERVIPKPPNSLLPPQSPTQLSWTPSFKTSLKYTPITRS